MTKEEILNQMTFKAESYSVERRVWETLNSLSGAKPDQTIKFVGLLVAHLAQNGLISDQELDDLLFKLVT